MVVLGNPLIDNHNIDEKKLELLKKSYENNSGAISSADNKASIILSSISLIVGFYSLFIYQQINNSTLTFNFFQSLFLISVILCYFFSLWAIWPRFNIRDENPLDAPQMFFFHYIAGTKPSGIFKKISELAENIFPVKRGKNNDPKKGKDELIKKLENINDKSLLNEYIDQTWELAQIAERKMWLIRGSSIWLFLSIFFLILSLYN